MVLNALLAITFLGFSYLVRLDIVLVSALVMSAALSFFSLLPRIKPSFVTTFALVNATLMFFYFYRFFSAVPMLDHRWYAQIEYVPVWVVLLAGFSSMYILASNSCYLKREFEIPKEVWLKCWLDQLKTRRHSTQPTT